MIPLNQNLSTLKRSAIRVYSNLARETEDCAMLTIGEPDFDTPEAIKLAAMAALQDNQTHYAPNQGTLALRRAIADFETARGNETGPDNVLVTIGACHALFTALFGILNPLLLVISIQAVNMVWPFMFGYQNKNNNVYTV